MLHEQKKTAAGKVNARKKEKITPRVSSLKVFDAVQYVLLSLLASCVCVQAASFFRRHHPHHEEHRVVPRGEKM